MIIGKQSKSLFEQFLKCNCQFKRCSTVANKVKDPVIEVSSVKYPTDDWTKITPKVLSLIGKNLHENLSNPLGLLAQNTRKYFNQFDYIKFSNPVVDLEANFDSLLIPKDHVSRKKSDSYYVNSNLLLRCHTSAHQADCLKLGSTAFVCIADVYRRDEVDRTHFPAFHQCELLKLYQDDDEIFKLNSVIPFEREPCGRDEKQEAHTREAAKLMETKLKLTIEKFIKHLFGDEIQMRWVDAYFPFTHPSFELEIFFNSQWLEILGAGIVENQVLTRAGVQNKLGWAAGFGLERLAMIRYNIPDIRLFWSRDKGVLAQFENRTCDEKFAYKPVSVYPPVINDLSFWLPENSVWVSNDFYELVRSVGGDLVEQVILIDEFTNKEGRKSHCYRIIYRGCDRALKKEEINVIHKQIYQTTAKELGAEIRV